MEGAVIVNKVKESEEGIGFDAIHETMEQMGMGYKQMESMEIICPVLSVHVDYISMVRFDDTVVIETRIAKYDDFNMELEYKIYNDANGDLCATALSRHCFLNRAGKPISLKRTYPELDTRFFEMKDDRVMQ